MVKIAVFGTGTMGHGIALILANAGHEVVFWGHNQGHLDSGMERINERLGKMADKGLITPKAKEAALARITPTLDMENAQGNEFAIEAIVENLKEKQRVFAQLGKIIPNAVHATNTSSISIDDIAKAGKNPKNVIGMHFFNPPYIMKLVEVIRGKKTSDETYRKTVELGQSLGKTCVSVGNVPGFVANRLLMAYINDAILLYEKKVASREGIDTVAKLGFNHPMGPLELADFIGLDVTKDILEAIYKGTKDKKYKPCALLAKMVRKGELGKKSGKGFYDYGK